VGKLNLWQTCHKFGEKSSKIVPLGAPLLKPAVTFTYAAFALTSGTAFWSLEFFPKSFPRFFAGRHIRTMRLTLPDA
jgi:hypothetical protein